MEKEVFETRMSSKGQIIIVKEIRDKLGLQENQKFIEKLQEKRIILEPVPSLSQLGGFLKTMGKNKKTIELVAEARKGWD